MTSPDQAAQDRANALLVTLSAKDLHAIDAHGYPWALKDILAAFAAVRAEELERCAKVALEYWEQEETGLQNQAYLDACNAIYDAIHPAPPAKGE